MRAAGQKRTSLPYIVRCSIVFAAPRRVCRPAVLYLTACAAPDVNSGSIDIGTMNFILLNTCNGILLVEYVRVIAVFVADNLWPALI